MTTADALTAAARILASHHPEKPPVCAKFYVPRGGNLHHCHDCDAPESLHVIKALAEAVKALACPECEGTGMVDVTFNSDPTTSKRVACDQCQEGKDLAQAERERAADEGMVSW